MNNTNVNDETRKRQLDIIKKIRNLNDTEFQSTGKHKYYHVLTMGCQMNAHDSEKLSGMLSDMGYIETDSDIKADFIIYNTCCVRENAELKVYGKLGYLKHYKEKNPDVIIAVCGCMMQQSSVIEKLKKSYRNVDIIFGTFNLYKFPELVETHLQTKQSVIDIWEEQQEIIEDLPSIRKYSYKSAVNIMYGCNNFCSYCIVPYVRGRERSRYSQDIINEIKVLASDGVKEIMLLGQNVNSYGFNLDENITFSQLLRKVDEIEGIERIRFMTSHPKDLSDDLIDAIKDCDKVCNHLHLPFQAGSNSILQKMNRKYTKEQYLELVKKIKDKIPNIALTTDIIIGFPGETENDIDETIDVIKKVKFNSAFTFLYSKRTGTPAALMENQVSEKVAKEGFNRVLEVLNPIVYEKNKEHIGKSFKVLVEESSVNDNNLVTGRLEDNSIVHFEGNSELIGNIVNVEITGCKTFYLMGKMI